ncbi:GcrA family cell cycle regulator [Xanthobacter aminoxidans]|uniref:GcrA family cell cycle regulator n=1 Tax=Xanthobacter aminoxidans TaxID=186280 RepID=UPI002022DFBD|nr:GcrA family cell cycle regulator [Xanthobacter aminoxidans]MCL8385546.1 GcrA family cell cycle regulator [Xanthobacter aminoxidans]
MSGGYGDRAWTEAQDALLLDLRTRKGYTHKQIAEALSNGPRPGTTRNACIGRLMRLAPDYVSEERMRRARERSTRVFVGHQPARAARPVPETPARRAPDQARPARPAQPAAARPLERVARLVPLPRSGAGPTEAPSGAGCTLFELTEQSCRWPVGNPGAAGFHFCGGPAFPGRPYCLFHARVAYQPLSDRPVRAPADVTRARPAPSESEIDLVDAFASGEAA